MRFMVIVILGLHCCFIAGADTVSAVIKGDTLVRGPAGSAPLRSHCFVSMPM